MQAPPWIHSARIDSAFILAPPLAASALALLILASGHAHAGVRPWLWLLLIVGVDVAHVYSTLYRTYLDRIERRRLSAWLIATPLGAWVLGVLLYSWDAMAFWSALAYVAVFHFVRQQYGFLMLYSRTERDIPRWCRQVDQFSIYGATVFPLLYWHTHLPRPFVWFIDGDFLKLPPALWRIAGPVYLLLFLVYLGKELWLIVHRYPPNKPRIAILLGTWVSWYVGIVVASGDLIFTLTNVVAHGVPYMALMYVFASRRDQQLRRAHSLFTWRLIPLSFGFLILLAFLEEGAWDGLVWREHLAFFPGFDLLPRIDSNNALSLLVPLLSIPQMTHYVLDGVIWRLRTHPEWRATLFWQPTPSTAELR